MSNYRDSRMFTGLRIIILYLTLCTIGKCERVCEPETGSCPGERNRVPLREGCCPARTGEACGDDVSVYCDSELGYRCLDENREEGRGTCQGEFELRVQTLQEKQATIEWRPFVPAGYNMEYSLMYRRINYSDDLSTWATFECGDEAEYTLLNLNSSSWYFIRIGVWNIPFNNTYSQLTETLMIKTKDVEYCRHAGNEYEVGQVFNNNNEDRCTCLKTGNLDCTSLCPNSSNPACHIETRNDCFAIECDTVFANCSINGTAYIHNEVFEQGCRECTCRDGQAVCILPLICEEMEDTEECPRPKPHVIEGQCCPEWECGESVPTSCEYNGRQYSAGYRWQDKDTCETCRCEQGGVVCDQSCEEPEIPKDCPRPNRRKAPNGCCEIYECLQPVDICVYANGAIKRGTFFTSDKCELCVCNENMTVECYPSCPEEPPALPLPSVICRKPHYRLVNCCKTIFCQPPGIDLISAIKNVYATSYTPHSVTVSFDAMRQRTEEEEPGEGELYTEFQIYFADAEESKFHSNWSQIYIHRTPVESQADEVTSPSLLFENTDLFLVKDRAYITISDLLPNTTYYFMIHPMKTNGGNPNDAGITEHTTVLPDQQALLAVKTLAKYLTCTVNGRKLQNEETYVDECERSCICRAGESVCQNNCHQMNTVMMPSQSCPQPKLEKRDKECCPSWRCHPKENGCRYGIAILKDGEQIREGCEKVCTCEKGNLICRPVCNDTNEAPRKGCRQQQIPNHCCKAWMCPPDKRAIKSVESVLRIWFKEKCLEPIDNFRGTFQTELSTLVHQRCNSMAEPQRHMCAELDIVVHCTTPSSRNRRSTDTITVDFGLSIPSTRSGESLSYLNNSLQIIIEGLAGIFNTSKSVTLNVNSAGFTTTGQLYIKSIIYACDEGYTFHKDYCVRTELSNTEPSFTLELSPLSVGSNSAVLGWESLTKIGVTYVIALQIEYREDNYTNWNQTLQFKPHVTSHTLTELESESIYRARLVALTSFGTRPMVPTRDLVFKTKAFGANSEFAVSLENVQVGQTSVVIRWRPMTTGFLKSIKSMEISYNEISKPLSSTTLSVQPSLNKYSISSLKESTNYVAMIHIMFQNGTRIRAGTIHFITDSPDKSSNLAIPLAVSAVIIVCAIIIVLITCCMWRKSRLKNLQETSFENKVYGIQIHNDGRVWSART